MLALTLTDRAVLVEFLRQLLLGLPSSSVNTIASWAFAEALETSLKGRPHPNPTTLSGDFDLTYIRPRPFRPVTGVFVAGFDLVGSISFGLVSIPVRLAVATEKKDLAFHMLHRKDGSRIKQRYFCAVDDQPLELEDLARGFEVTPGHFVLVTEEDFDGIPISSLKSIAFRKVPPCRSSWPRRFVFLSSSLSLP